MLTGRKLRRQKPGRLNYLKYKIYEEGINAYPPMRTRPE